MNMEDKIFKIFCRQRKLSHGSIKIYHNALTKYTEFTGMTLKELLDEADTDERQGKPWKERRLKDKLLNFKIYLIEKEYVNSTVQDYVKKVKSWYDEQFHELNNKLGLGTTDNGYIILRCHNLRKFHSTSLKNDGLSIDFVNALQGKSKTSVDEVYFLDDPETLKQEYISHLDCLTVNMDVHNVSFKSKEFIELERENQMYRDKEEKINSILERLERLEKM